MLLHSSELHSDVGSPRQSAYVQHCERADAEGRWLSMVFIINWHRNSIDLNLDHGPEFLVNVLPRLFNDFCLAACPRKLVVMVSTLVGALKPLEIIGITTDS